MANYAKSGTLTANGTTDEVAARGSVTFAATTSGGTPGTLAWQYKTAAGTWTPVLDGTTAIESSANYMKTINLGGDFKLRGSLTGSTGATWVWSIVSASGNQG